MPSIRASLLLLLLAAGTAAGQTTLRSDDFGFAVTLPKGYQRPKPKVESARGLRTSHWLSAAGAGNWCSITATEFPQAFYRSCVDDGTWGFFEKDVLLDTAMLSYCEMFRGCRISEERDVGLQGAWGRTFRLQGHFEGVSDLVYGRVALSTVENRRYAIELYSVRRGALESAEANALFRSLTFRWPHGRPPRDSITADGRRVGGIDSGRCSFVLPREFVASMGLSAAAVAIGDTLLEEATRGGRVWRMKEPIALIMANYQDYPEGQFLFLAHSDTLREQWLDSVVVADAVGREGSTEINRRPIRVNGLSGRSLTLRRDVSGTITSSRLDVLLDPPRLYRLVYIATDSSQLEAPAVRAMFESFRVTPSLRFP